MRRWTCALLLAASLVAAVIAETPQSSATLDIYVVDTEGGAAILFVSPSGESALVDTGHPGDRDHLRLMEVLLAAGVTKIDHLLITHFHADHAGGLEQLADTIPVAHIIDYGLPAEGREPLPGFRAMYTSVRGKTRHTSVKPGDRIPIAGIDWRIVAAAGASIASPIAGAPGAGQANAACAASPARQQDLRDEDAQSIGSLVTFGQFRAVHLADLLWDRELALVCPENKLGQADLYLASHHGADVSGSPALVHALRPRVAVMQNGPRTGGEFSAASILRSSPGLEDVWQLHWSHHLLAEYNPAGVFIANIDDPISIAEAFRTSRQTGGPLGPATTPSPAAVVPPQGGPPVVPPAFIPEPGSPAASMFAPSRTSNLTADHSPAHYIKIAAEADGTFTVTNSRNGFSKRYTRR